MKIKMEIWVSITAMITAVAAVVVAILQTQVMHDEAALEREHARLSVQPSILVYAHSSVGDSGGSFAFGMINQGLGPAVVEGFSVEIDGETGVNWAQAIALATNGSVQLRGEKRNVRDISESSINDGMIIPAGNDIRPIDLGTNTEVAALLRPVSDKIKVSFCYCSLYNECWSANNKKTRPTKVENCQAFQNNIFNTLDSAS